MAQDGTSVGRLVGTGPGREQVLFGGCICIMGIASNHLDCVCLGQLAEELVNVMGTMPFAEGKGTHFVFLLPDSLGHCAYVQISFLVFIQTRYIYVMFQRQGQGQ